MADSFRDGINGKAYRAVRDRVARQTLVECGFERSLATYLKKVGQQIQAIDFQPSRGRFTINLALHWQGVPCIASLEDRPLSKWHLLDCAFSARLGEFLPARRDQWWFFGESVDECAQKLREVIAASLSVLDDYYRRWPTTASLARLVSLEQVQMRRRSSALGIVWDAAFEPVWPWSATWFGLCYALATGEIGLGNKQRALEYARLAEPSNDLVNYYRAWQQLMNFVQSA